MARTLSRDEKIEWLQLCRSGGVGPQTFSKLLRRFGSARKALLAPAASARGGRRVERIGTVRNGCPTLAWEPGPVPIPAWGV